MMVRVDKTTHQKTILILIKATFHHSNNSNQGGADSMVHNMVNNIILHKTCHLNPAMNL